MLVDILTVLKNKYKSEMDVALVNIKVYHNPVGIGEHPDIVEAVETQFEKYVDAKERYKEVCDLIETHSLVDAQ